MPNGPKKEAVERSAVADAVVVVAAGGLQYGVANARLGDCFAALASILCPFWLLPVGMHDRVVSTTV